MMAGSGFLTWFSQWGQIVYVVVQMAFWIALSVAAIVIARQYAKSVAFRVARGSGDDELGVVAGKHPARTVGVPASVPVQDATVQQGPATAGPISIEPFID